ncbi:cell division protein FtsA [Rickettsiaceae bacterium]|nr:cell division protein FtsA [Rickettsiaceae bacterium]
MKGKSSNFIAFDIGSSKISAIASHINKQGQAQVNAQILQYSEGFKAGNIVNMKLAENSLIDALYALEKECDKSIKEVAISLSGARVKSYYISHTVKLGNQAISKQDVKKLITKGLAEFKVKDQEIIHYFPMEFSIDDNQVVEDPIGMHARSLSCQLHIISADSLMLLNLTKCLSRCHVEVSEIVLSIYASGLACLSEDDKEMGSIIIDIGSNITSFGIFWKGKLAYVGHVPLGGASITTDIAKAFSVRMATADKLKILFGNANPSLLIKDATIRLEEFEPESNYDADLSITASQLANIINERMSEIFAQIQEKYNKASMDHLIAKRMVITGGGAALPGIKSLAAEMFQRQVRIAKPENIPGFAENYNPCTYASVIGMIKSKSLQYQKNYFKSDRYGEAGWFKKTFTWLRENI